VRSRKTGHIQAHTGCALTVLRSPRKSRFGVRILGSLPAGGVGGLDLIVARAFGRAIGRSSGVPAGASGSPVWVGGKLIGAISAVVGGDNHLVGITPLAAMLTLKEEPSTTLYAVDAKELTVCQRFPLVLACAGFSVTRVVAELEGRYATKINGAAPLRRSWRSNTALSPGSPIGAALMTGDLQFGFIGTITLVRNQEVFAFGHPLLYAGATQYPMTTAEIIDTAHGPVPAKVGVLGNIVGSILQDRGAGTYGRLNHAPQGLVDLALCVTDLDRQKQMALKVQVVPIPGELPFLVYIAAMETLTRAMNRVGRGTGRWQWTVHVVGQDAPIVFSDEQYDPIDIAFVIAYSGTGVIAEPLGQGQGLRAVKLEAAVSVV